MKNKKVLTGCGIAAVIALIVIAVLVGLFINWWTKPSKAEVSFENHRNSYVAAAESLIEGKGDPITDPDYIGSELIKAEKESFVYFKVEEDFYAPALYYIPSDSHKNVPSCSFDGYGERIEKYWFVCSTEWM